MLHFRHYHIVVIDALMAGVYFESIWPNDNTIADIFHTDFSR